MAELDEGVYQQGFQVENIGYHEEDDVKNIDIFTELDLLKHSDLKIEWMEYVEYDDNGISLDGKPIHFIDVAGKFKLVLQLKAATKKHAEKYTEIKGRQKTAILINWMAKSGNKIALLSEAEWTQLLVVELNLKVSISKQGYCSVSKYDSQRAYYKVEKSKRKGMRKDAEHLLTKLFSQTVSKKESAYNEVDKDGLNEYDREVIGQAVELLSQYGINTAELEIPFA